MTNFIPYLDKRQSIIVISALASTIQTISTMYRDELGEERIEEYEELATKIIKDAKNATSSGLSYKEERLIVRVIVSILEMSLVNPRLMR